MRHILQTILAFLTRLTLARYHPKIIGITGSVGKTSTKEAIFCALKTKFKVRASPENYNNEIGLPLAVIAETSAKQNPFKWLGVVIGAFAKLLISNYPEILILELGADRPGDIGYLISLVSRLDMAVITDIGVSHLEFFGDQQALAKEKLSILKGLDRNGVAVLNFDNPNLREAAFHTKQKVISYGFGPDLGVSASDFKFLQQTGEWGINFKVHYLGTVVPFFIPGALGRPVALACTAAAAIGLQFGMNLVEISEALKNFVPPAGRLRLVAWLNNTWILDDTYNSAPASCIEALTTLSQISRSRKLAALGLMAELGTASEPGQKMVANKILEQKIDAVFLVGGELEVIEQELKAKGFSGEVFHFSGTEQAAEAIKQFLKPQDTILVKGSQAARMEKIVKAIMAHPEQAGRLLVRQTSDWF